METTQNTSDLVMPRGKYKGKKLREIDDWTLLTVWGAWNGAPKLVRDPFFRLLTMEVKSRGVLNPRFNDYEPAMVERYAIEIPYSKQKPLHLTRDEIVLFVEKLQSKLKEIDSRGI